MKKQNKYGDILKSMRTTAGLNHEQLGVAIDRSGQTIRNWEKGTHIPDVAAWDNIKKVCKVKASKTPIPDAH